MTKLLLLALLSTLAASTSALAQTPAPAAAEEPTVERRYSARTVMDFTEAHIQGDLQRPEGTYCKAKKKTAFRNLIELRSNFRPELATSPAGL